MTLYENLPLILWVLGIALLIVQLVLIRNKKYKDTLTFGVIALIFLIIAQSLYFYQRNNKDSEKKTNKKEQNIVAHSWHGLTDGDGTTTGLGWVL